MEEGKDVKLVYSLPEKLQGEAGQGHSGGGGVSGASVRQQHKRGVHHPAWQ